jgi:hypothetical protein
MSDNVARDPAVATSLARFGRDVDDYDSSAVLKSPRDQRMLLLSIGRVGPVDITVGNAARLGASQRSTTRRCASLHIATQRASRRDTRWLARV